VVQKRGDELSRDQWHGRIDHGSLGLIRELSVSEQSSQTVNTNRVSACIYTLGIGTSTVILEETTDVYLESLFTPYRHGDFGIHPIYAHANVTRIGPSYGALDIVSSALADGRNAP
jgi:hypothetical protein